LGVFVFLPHRDIDKVVFEKTFHFFKENIAFGDQ